MHGSLSFGSRRLNSLIVLGMISLSHLALASQDPELAAVASLRCPAGPLPASGWPAVITVNGNAFGAVRADGMAAALATSFVQRRLCATAIAHRPLTSRAVFENDVMRAIEAIAKDRRVNPRRLGIAGFSGGGAVALLALTRYPRGLSGNLSLLAGISYYGPVDLAQYFDFHGRRAAGDEFRAGPYAGEKGASQQCRTARGNLSCRAFSQSCVNVVGANVGGATTDKLDYFSASHAIAERLQDGSAQSIGMAYGCYGMLDDNITAQANRRLLSDSWSMAGVPFQWQSYRGGHGVSANQSCPAAAVWLQQKLTVASP